MDFMQLLSKDQERRMNKELLTWVKKALKGKHSVYIYNLISHIRQMVEAIERDHA